MEMHQHIRQPEADRSRHGKRCRQPASRFPSRRKPWALIFCVDWNSICVRHGNLLYSSRGRARWGHFTAMPPPNSSRAHGTDWWSVGWAQPA